MMMLIANLIFWGLLGASLLGVFGIVVQAIVVGFLAFGVILLCLSELG